MIAGRRRGIPVVATYHTHYPDYVPHITRGKLPSALGELGAKTAKGIVRHIFGMADVVTAPTRELAGELRSYGLKRVVHLPNGIDLAKIRCAARDVAAFRKAHGIVDGTKAAIYLGRLSFEKKVDVLIEAFRMVKGGDKILIIAGGGPSLEKFRELAGIPDAKNIVFTGFVERPAAAYRAAQVFVSASESETFGLTFVEAMHMGLPAIGVRKLGAKEVITDGKDGLLVEPGDPAALACAMERLLDDGRLRRRMGAEGRKTARRYAIQNSVKETLAIYRRLLERRGGPADVRHRRNRPGD
jgi:glycosyltransferase involved in cell wall biosynthesis